MPDKFTPEQRSAIMKRVGAKNTGAEMIVRRIAHGLGYRFRLHRKILPGCPDLVFPSRHKVVFVNGCFWHQHDCRRGNRMPQSNVDYWRNKLQKTKDRDSSNRSRLSELGWSSLVLWECEIRSRESTTEMLVGFLGWSRQESSTKLVPNQQGDLPVTLMRAQEPKGSDS